ncbi:hypothetical protein Csa_015461 [Cucumis sativus]|nr:hypothetical protein Csa_015461 [Cucumis sativus]
MGSMNEDTVTQMIGCNTTREIWLTLEQTYFSSNTTKIMQLKGQLQNLKKGNQSIRDYTTKVKNLVSALNEDSVPAAQNKVKIEKVGEFKMVFVETPNMSEIHWVPGSINSNKFLEHKICYLS